MRPSRFSPNKIAEIVSLAKDGARLKDICGKFGNVHHSFIQGILKRNGLSGPPRMLLSDAKLKLAISIYKVVRSSKKVAEAFGVSSRTILDALHREGAPIRERCRFDDTTERIICDRYLHLESST